MVEDNADHQVIIKNVLARWAEANRSQVEFASSVSEALEKLSSSSFDLVLIDYRLPDKMGPDFLNEIKSRDLKFPVLLMTSAGDEPLAVDALKSGFMDHIVKSESSFHKLPETIETA